MIDLKKLASESGASLSFALLLFLVCATVGGVVLAAGTIASGRFSELVKMDQRYYSVTSAAQLLESELTKADPVKINRMKVLKERVTTTETLDSEGYVINTETKTDYSVYYKTTINSNTVELGNPDNWMPDLPSDNYSSVPTPNSLLTKIATKLMFPDEKCNTDDSLENTFEKGFKTISLTTPTPTPIPVNMEHTTITLDSGTDTNTVIDPNKLVIGGKAVFKENETLVINLQNGKEDGGDVKNKYVINLVLEPEIQDGGASVYSEMEDTSPGLQGNTYITQEITTTTTSIDSEISWKVQCIEKGVDKESAEESPTPTP